MTNKATKYGIIIIAAVLIVAMAFAGAASAEPVITITNSTGLYDLKNVNDVVSGNQGTATLESITGDTYTLVLNNFNVTNDCARIIVADVPNLTIKLVGDSNLRGNTGNVNDCLLYASGNLTITAVDDGKLLVNNTATMPSHVIYANKELTIKDGTITAIGNGAGGKAIYAYSDVTIEDGKISAIANGGGNAINANIGNVAINAGTVNATATGGYGYAIFAHQDVVINDGTVNATATGSNGKAISANIGNVTIIDGTVTATATGSSGYAIFAWKNVIIKDGMVNATATTSAIHANNNDVTIEDGTVNAISALYAIDAVNDVIINNGMVNATANGDNCVAIYAGSDGSGNVAINAGTVTATATGASNCYAIYAASNVIITSVDQLIANGTDAAFAYSNGRNFSALGDNYEYWVNSTGSVLPLIKLTYEQFNANGNWTGTTPIMSAYTNVLIQPGVPPVPTYPIKITNASGTYQLNEAMTKVFGDDGSGYAELTNVDKATETYTLELNNFNVTKEGMSIINASVPNLTIKLVGDSNLTGNITGGSIGLLYSSGNLTITTDDDDGKLLVNNTAASGYTNAICVNFGNITIADGTVNAIATGDMGYAIYAKSGNITIADGTVDVIGKSAGISAINGNITIANGTVDATGTEYNGISVFSSGKNITIAGGTVNATGKQNGIYAISGSIIIANGTVTATATNTSSKAIFAVKNVSINGGIVTATATGTEGTAIFAEKNVVINGGVVTATGGDMGCAIFAKNDVAIENGTITATDASGFAIYARNNVTITSVAQLIANGSVASFAYGNARNFSVLGDNYAYWVNSTGSALPLIKLTYEQFDADGNWNGTTPIQSVYTNVLIKPDTTPAPAYTPSSSSHSGGSVILQPGQVAPTQQPTVAPTVKPTVKPTAIPTEKPATPTVAPTANPTAQQTQASPAPILGLIAGLGVAGLVLRLRK